MRNFALTLGAIFAGGLLLDMMGSGKLGNVAKNLAKKITNGYGV